ncbi:MAG: histone deacetylase [Chloroflexota bacterium]
MKVGLVYDDIYLRHDTGEHPENAQRLSAVMSHLETTGLLPRLTRLKPSPANEKELRLVHTESHIRHVREVAEGGGGYLDLDTVVSPESYEVALYAVGGVIRAVQAVMSGEVGGAFALVRPPGHHAGRDRGMGFCLFNNIAIAASYALKEYPLSRLAIIDFDVHHGNGTQEIFEAAPRVLYVSTHESPLYPGTGRLGETGSDEAKGTKVNIPLPAGSGDSEYQRVYTEIIMPVVARFKPELILVSAGYDAHWADGLAMMRLSVSGYAGIAKNIKSLADELCQGRVVLSLEGGYNLSALSSSIKATLDTLMGDPSEDPIGNPPHPPSPPDITPIVQALKKIHHLD